MNGWWIFWLGAAVLLLIVAPGIKTKAAPAWRGVIYGDDY
jgi:hypothetical protein